MPWGGPRPTLWLGWCSVTMTGACWSAGLAWLGLLPQPQPRPQPHPLPNPLVLPLALYRSPAVLLYSPQALFPVLPPSLFAHPPALLPSLLALLDLSLPHSKLPIPLAFWPLSHLCQLVGCLAPVPQKFCLTSHLAHHLQILVGPLSLLRQSHLMSTW